MPKLYDENHEIIGVVDYTENLDAWNGSNWQCGGTGLHMGIGKLKDGRWYLCHGSQWQGSVDYAEIISEERAKQLCLEHNLKIYVELFGEEPSNLTAE